jgi:hypothetical protein
MSAHDSSEGPLDDAQTGDHALDPGSAQVPQGTRPVDVAFVVGAIRAHAPELADDLDDAISIWLGQADVIPFGRAVRDRLVDRRSRLEALQALLALSPFEPDPRD